MYKNITFDCLYDKAEPLRLRNKSEVFHMAAIVLMVFAIFLVALIFRFIGKPKFTLLPPDKKNEKKVKNSSKIHVEKSDSD